MRSQRFEIDRPMVFFVDLAGCHSSMWQLRVTVMTKVSPLWFDSLCPAEVLQLERADKPVQSHVSFVVEQG